MSQTYHEGTAKKLFVDLLDHLSPAEIETLRERITGGWIIGSMFHEWNGEIGECGCIYGTALILRGKNEGYGFAAVRIKEEFDAIVGETEPNPDAENDEEELLSRYEILSNDLEEMVYGISLGDTPETNPISAQLIAWIDEYNQE